MAKKAREETDPANVNECCGEETRDEVEGPGTCELGGGEKGLQGMTQG